METRVANLEARLQAITYILAIFVVVTVINSFAILTSLQGASQADWNYIAVNLSIIEIFLAMIAIGGFWLSRVIVAEKAKEEAEIVATEHAVRVAEREARNIAGPIARRAALEQLASVDSEEDGSLSKIVEAMGDANEEVPDEK